MTDVYLDEPETDTITLRILCPRTGNGCTHCGDSSAHKSGTSRDTAPSEAASDEAVQL